MAAVWQHHYDEAEYRGKQTNCTGVGNGDTGVGSLKCLYCTTYSDQIVL